MTREEINVVVGARTRGDHPCQLTIVLGHAEGWGEYLRGTLLVEILSLRLEVPLTTTPESLRTFLGEARTMDAHRLGGKAVLWNYDMLPVLALTWVPVRPPIIVMSGEYVGPFCHRSNDDPEKYPHRALNTVQYTGLVIALGDVDRLVAEMESGLDRLSIP